MVVPSQVRPLASPRPICPGKVSRGLAWPSTFLLPAGILRPVPGLCPPRHPQPCLPPPSRPAWPLAPSAQTRRKGEGLAHPHLRPFLAPEELGVLPTRVRGSQLGINSSAGGGDRDFHSQTLKASHPGWAGQPSSCPHGLHGLSAAPVSPGFSHQPPAAAPSHMLLPAPLWLNLPVVPWGGGNLWGQGPSAG